MRQDRRAAPLPVSFFRRDVASVARELLGAIVVSGAGTRRTAGRIVEVEAYLGAADPASHAWRYRRHRQNEALYGPPGSWYVYRSYGIHWCTNLVAGTPGEGGAVLLRALEPVAGLPLMRRRRRTPHPQLLCAGPGRLTSALRITRALDGWLMAESAVVVLPGQAVPASEIAAGPRIGISRARDWPLRFLVRGSPWVSRRGPA